MEKKTKVHAENDMQDLKIVRDFDLPVELLFRAYQDPAIVEQWMGTKVLKQESVKHGSYHYQTSDPAGNIVFSANGTFHEFIADRKITRTFEMADSPFDVQLEFLEFEKLTDETSRLTIHIIYRSVGLRDQMLKLPFEYGLNMAHDRLEDILTKLKKES